LLACRKANTLVCMPNRPTSRDDQAWEIFLILLASRQPDENPFRLAQDAYRAADAFERTRYEQEPERSAEPQGERRNL
jgi:hypothetical protein